MGEPTEPTSTDFRVWPVLDLLGGHVVRGVAGNRAEYRPLTGESRPVQVVENLVNDFGSVFHDFYVADLDALQGGEFQREQLRQLCAQFPQLHFWIDAGFATLDRVRAFETAIGADAHRNSSLVIATETLASWQELKAISDSFDGRIAFSLDLVGGVVRATCSEISQQSPTDIVTRLVGLAIRDVIVLDVAQVGIRDGVSTLSLCQQIVEKCPTMRLITGGGVRGVEDLRAIRRCGCRAGLVATALHDGSITHKNLAIT